ncbi:MAG: hypothetical protein WC992_08810 [Acholeplasmataceae bacterium]
MGYVLRVVHGDRIRDEELRGKWCVVLECGGQVLVPLHPRSRREAVYVRRGAAERAMSSIYQALMNIEVGKTLGCCVATEEDHDG